MNDQQWNAPEPDRTPASWTGDPAHSGTPTPPPPGSESQWQAGSPDSGFGRPESNEAPGYAAPGYETPGYEAPGYETPGHNSPSYSNPSYSTPTYDATGYSASTGYGSAYPPASNAPQAAAPQPPAQPYAQDPYAGSGYSAPAPSAPPAYPSAPSAYPSAPAYAQPGYTQPGYPANYSASGSERPSKRGVTALILAFLALAISVPLSVWFAQAYISIINITGTTDFNTDNLPPAADNSLMAMGFSVFGQLIPTGLGIAAFIVGLTALKTTSRGAAIGAIIVSVLAPFISFGVTMVLMANHV